MDDNPRVVANLTNFIQTLGIDDEVNVAQGAHSHQPKGDYDPPWIFILSDASAKLRSFLLWQQTFVVPNLAFNVVPFDPLLRSWVIMNLSGDIVTKDPKIVCKALGAIKSTLWKSESFRHITNQCLATWDRRWCIRTGL
jgi:hypothetical protein